MHYAKHIRQQFFVMVKPQCWWSIPVLISDGMGFRKSPLSRTSILPGWRWGAVEGAFLGDQHGWVMEKSVLSWLYGNTGWWFGTRLLFFHIYIYGEESSQLSFIFFRGVETTNQNITPSMFLGLLDLLGNSWFLIQKHHYHICFSRQGAWYWPIPKAEPCSPAEAEEIEDESLSEGGKASPCLWSKDPHVGRVSSTLYVEHMWPCQNIYMSYRMFL